MLTIVAMALLSGARTIAEIHRFGQRLKPHHRARLGLPRNKQYPKLFAIPGYKVYGNRLSKLSMDAFAAALNAWLQAGQDSLPKSLAMDGKMIRNLIGVLSISEHETGAPLAVAIQTEKEGDGEHCEMNVGRRTLDSMAPLLDGAVVTSDALHTQRDNALRIANVGGTYVFQVRGNQKKLRALAKTKAQHSPLLPTRKPSRLRDMSLPSTSASTTPIRPMPTSPAPARSSS